MPPNDWNVAELVDRCSRRPPDESAWEEFVRRYHTTIRANVQKTFHRKAREEADRRPQFPDDVIEDLVQSVYIRLVEDRSRALQRFEGEHQNSIYQYLKLISINVVLDHFRQEKAIKRPKVSYSLDQLMEDQGDSALPGGGSGREGGVPDTTSFLLHDIEQALDKVVTGKNRNRDLLIFKLHYFDGLTSEEIIEVMGLDISTIGVNSILNRIVKKVREMLMPTTRH
ncbi:MAG TPA: sigma-70 family RNA polymerase sigma factor [Blastocatellia bacterium]|nr:sigma-70 family RNA polymerase sigma factor [Blastocatellia bacterium]